MKPNSKRFIPNRWTELVVPAVLLLLLMVLIATIVILFVAMLPGVG